MKTTVDVFIPHDDEDEGHEIREGIPKVCRYRVTSGVKSLSMFQDGKEKPKDRPLTAPSFNSSAAGPATSYMSLSEYWPPGGRYLQLYIMFYAAQL